MSTKGWIGVDLDGTLAEYHGWTAGEIGKPIPTMVARVKKWLANGQRVKVMTARVYWHDVYNTIADFSVFGEAAQDTMQRFADGKDQVQRIKAWCLEHIGQDLEVTSMKDFAMVELWDDRAVAVEPNTGRAFSWREEHAADVDHVPIQVVDRRRVS